MKLKKYSDPNFIAKLIKEPETVIDNFELVYVGKPALAIRRKRINDSFVYKLKDKVIEEAYEIDRINQLAIPPAWKKVRIAIPVNGHLQAVGRDVKNRKQYRYHSLWQQIRNQTKFFKMASFGEQLPKLRKQVAKDLKQDGWPQAKVIALIIKIMEETHIRIGNKQYAKRNKTYGLVTLRNKHVSFLKDEVAFNFIGKKGKEHAISLKNKKLIRLINECEEIPGWRLFQYYDDNGIKQDVTSGMVNDYIHTITGVIYTAKDYRTWAATTIFFETLYKFGIAKNKKKTKKNILKAYDKCAEALGNTRNVCRKYYVHPAVVNKYITKEIEEDFKKNSTLKNGHKNLSISETVVLNLIKNYVPNFLKNTTNP